MLDNNAKPKKFQLTYLRADGSAWEPPKQKTAAQKATRRRYLAKALPSRRETWISKVCAMFFEAAEERGAAMALAEARRDAVRDAFNKRLSKAAAVERLAAAWAHARIIRALEHQSKGEPNG